MIFSVFPASGAKESPLGLLILHCNVSSDNEKVLNFLMT